MKKQTCDGVQASLLLASGELLQGGLELLTRWQQDASSKIWLDIQQSPTDEEVELLSSFGCHELAIKDAHRLRHPPKVEHFEDMTFILFRGISDYGENLNVMHLEIAFFIGDRFLITRHDSGSYSISSWLKNEKLATYLDSPAELAIKIIHFSAGKYLELLLGFEESLSELEDLMQAQSNDDMLRELTIYKTRLRKLRRVFDYHQKMFMHMLQNPAAQFVNEQIDLSHQLQDLYERCERVHSLSSMFYEICGDLIEGYISLSSHQLNLAMRVLTVITAVFVPLSFIAGLYGMNFDYMPELKFAGGYFMVLGTMFTTAFGLLVVFRKKGWI